MIVSELVALLGFNVNPQGAQQFDNMMNRMQQNATAVATSIERTFANVGLGIAAAFGAAALVAKPIAEAGDAMNSAIARIESSIGRSATSGQEAIAIYDQLYEAGKRTGVSADASAAAFSRFQLAMDDLKRPASDTIKLVEGIQAAGVVAGSSTSELSATMLQLGQALASGKLNGDELRSLRENAPRFLRDVIKELNMSQADFFKAAEKGALTPQLIVPALLKASEQATQELSKFPVSMARGMAIARNAAQRFLAELDKQLKLSETLARIFVYIGNTLDSWRSGLSVVGDLVRSLGGLEGIARLVGIALLVAFAGSIIGAVTSLVGLFGSLARAILVSSLPLAAFAAWFLIVEDFITWMQGGKSLFGDRLGEFDQIAGPIRDKLQGFIDWFKENFGFGDIIQNTINEINGLREFFSNAVTYIQETWNRNIEGMKPQFEWLRSVAGLLMEAFRPLGDFLAGVIDVIIGKFKALYDNVASVIGGIKGLIGSVGGMLSSMEGTGTGTNPEKQEQGRRNMGTRGALQGFPEDANTLVERGRGLSEAANALVERGRGLPEAANALVERGRGLPEAATALTERGFSDVTPRIGASPGGAGTVNAPQNNTITNQVTINAPGADPASVASGVNAGMDRATDQMTTRLGGATATGLGIAVPRAEAPATP